MGFSVTFDYLIRDMYTATIKAMQRATNFLSTSLGTLGTRSTDVGNKLGKMSSKLANLRTGFAAMMAARGIKGAVTESYNFEKALNKVNAVTGASTEQMAIMRKEARKMGLETKFSSTQAAEAMAVLGQKGFDTAKILQTLPSILMMATAGDIELAAASQMVTGALYAFELQTSQAAHVGDVYAITAAKTAANMTDLNAAMINAAPLAHAAGISFEEVAALVGIMSNKNIMGSKSGTLLMNAFRNMVKPTREAVRVLKQFGFRKDEWTDETGKIVDFIKVLELFEKRGIGIAEIFKIFQIRGAKGTAALMGQTDAVRALLQEYIDLTDASKTMAAIMMWAVVGAAVEAKSAWDGLKEAIGKALEPITIGVMKFVKATSKFVAQRPALAKTIGVILLAITVVLSIVTVVGVVLASLAGMSLLVGTIFTGATISVGLLAGSIGLLIAFIALVIARWDDFKWLIQLVWEGIVTFASKVATAMFSVKDNIIEGLLWPFEKAIELWDKLSSIAGFGDSNVSLTSTAMSPGDLGTSNKITVENIIKGSIEVNDKTGGMVSTGAGGGLIPINVNQDDSYVYGGG